MECKAVRRALCLRSVCNSHLSGNEVYYTNHLILLVKNMLCSEHHCQKGFNLILFSFRDLVEGEAVRHALCLRSIRVCLCVALHCTAGGEGCYQSRLTTMC